MGRKSTTIALSNEDRDYLELQTRARTIQAQTVNRARILLLKAEGISIDDIADKVGMNRKSVMLCINKYLAGGIDNALFDAPGRGRNAEITDDEKAWIISIACQRPVDLGYAAETWTRALLTKHINKVAESAGHIRLSTVSQSKVRTILEEADIKPNKIRYYCEKRDPDFDQKMHNVLLVYKQLGSYVNAGTPLALVGDFQQMLFVVAVSDEDARGLEVGQRAQMEFDRADIVKMYDMKVSSGSTAGNPVCMARIVDISPAFSEPVAMRQIIWEVDNRAGILIPQTYSNVYLQSQETHRALSIPIAALDSARSEVFVAYEDGRLERRHVETGFEDGVYVEILSGLFEGEVVIVSGTDGLTDGVKAKVNLEQEES